MMATEVASSTATTLATKTSSAMSAAKARGSMRSPIRETGGQKKMAPTGRVHGRSHQPRSWGGSRRTPSPEDRGRVPQGQGARNRTRFNGTPERVRLISPLHVLGSMSSRPDHEAAELRDTARIEAFSDGVFAIAITLLVLELHVPPRGNLHGSLLGALAGHWPSYVAFLVSFVILG